MEEPFETPPIRQPDELTLNLDGWEGPLDLLLELARAQKVDIAKISIVALVDQYLAVIEGARRVRLELAADWLVMAAWLAWLKSRLLIPPEEAEGEDAEALAETLTERLAELERMRAAALWLNRRPWLGHDVFARGMPEPLRINRKSTYQADLYDLLKAYAHQRQRNSVRTRQVRQRPVWSLKEAREELERLLGMSCDWAPLDKLLAEFLVGPELRRTALASGFTATLEMTREGALELRQEKVFAPLLVRRRGPEAASTR